MAKSYYDGLMDASIMLSEHLGKVAIKEFSQPVWAGYCHAQSAILGAAAKALSPKEPVVRGRRGRRRAR